MQKVSLACFLLTCFLDGNGNSHGHTDHGVVACADEAHHLDAIRAFAEFRGERLGLQALRCKPFAIIALQNLVTPNTSFSVLLIALYRVFNVL